MPRNNERPKLTAKERLTRGAAIVALGATAFGLGACGNNETVSADNKATTTATATATPGETTPTTSPEAFKGVDYEVDPRTTEVYKNLSDSDKAFFDTEWNAPITPDSFRDDFQGRVKMSEITSRIFGQISNNVHQEERYDLDAFSVSYEQVAKNPSLAVTSLRQRIDLVVDLEKTAAQTYTYNQKAGVSADKITEYGQTAAQHIIAGLVKVWSTEDKEEKLVASAPIISYAKNLNQYFMTVYNRALDGETAPAYALPSVYTKDPNSYYTQGDQVEWAAGKGSYDVGRLVYDVRTYDGKPTTDDYGSASITLESTNRKGGAWAVTQVSPNPIEYKPIQ